MTKFQSLCISPIKDWTTVEVWEYLRNNPAPWGSSHEELMKYIQKVLLCQMELLEMEKQIVT